MPYITPTYRVLLENGMPPENPGSLNYLLTKQIVDYFFRNQCNYQTINDILGALEGCKLEFYRRIVIPYEDKKKLANGDCYEEIKD